MHIETVSLSAGITFSDTAHRHPAPRFQTAQLRDGVQVGVRQVRASEEPIQQPRAKTVRAKNGGRAFAEPGATVVNA